MRAFIVEKNTEIKVVQDGKEWVAPNILNHTTKQENMFFVEDLVVDPTGISREACIPGCVTVGSKWADAGWYGFRRDGWTALIPGNKISLDCE